MDFVETYFGEDDLKSFVKYFSLDKFVKGGDHKTDPIVKHGGLQAMLACFLKYNKDALKEFKAHLGGASDAKKAAKKPTKKQESSSESSSESSEEDKESSSSSSESEEEEKPAKKIVGQKRKAKETSSESESGSD